MEKKVSFESIARMVIDETMVIDENDCVIVKDGKPPIKVESAIKGLRRKFEKLVDHFGGDISVLGDNGRTTQFGELEQIFLHTVLTQIATDTGIAAELLKQPEREHLELSEIREFLQSMVEIMEDKEYNEDDILDNIPQLDAMFRFSVLTIAENCRRFVATLIWNIQGLPYLQQVGIMKKLEADMQTAWLGSTKVTVQEMILSEIGDMIRKRNIDVDIADIRKDFYKEE